MHWSFVWFGYLLTWAAIPHILLRNKPPVWNLHGIIANPNSKLDEVRTARRRLLRLRSTPETCLS